MKIVFICATNVIRGAEIVLGDYLLECAKTNKIIVVTNSKQEIQDFFTQIEGVQVIASHFFSSHGASKSIIGFLKKLQSIVYGGFFLRRLILQEMPNRIVGNNTGDMLFAWIRKLIKKEKRPSWIQFNHDIINTCYYLLMLKVGLPFINHFVAISKAVEQSLISNGIKKEKITVIYNGIEAQEFIKKPYCHDRLSFGFVGALENRKSPLSIIQLSDYLKNTLDFFYIAYGEKNEIVFNLLKKTIYSYKFKFFFNIERKILYDSVYKKIRFLFVPSIDEPFSMVTLEALSMGIPVIARVAGGIPEMIEDNFNGFLFQQDDDLAEISEKIKKLTQAQYDLLCYNAHQTSLKFSLENKKQKLDAIIFKKGAL